MMSAWVNLLAIPVFVSGFRLTLVGFDEERPMMERKMAGIIQTFLGLAFFGVVMYVNG